ncbi:MAG: hypothetical protein ACRDZ2_14160 [Ilumatobacteraceae bacterium]
MLDGDDLNDWLVDQLQSGSIDLVAPTSDYVAHAITAAHQRLGIVMPGHPTAAAMRDCLFKDRFALRMAEVGFPAPPAAAPRSLAEAEQMAAELGYPVVSKPRSHIGVGLTRGRVFRDPEELFKEFRPYHLFKTHAALGGEEPELGFPMLQKFMSHDHVDVVSVTGCLDRDGELVAFAHNRKLRAWPPALGIGSRFEALGEQPFTDRAVAAVQHVLGTGLFELEVLLDRQTGEGWPIDLNPRAWGQITLAGANGCDMPTAWYEVVTGTSVRRPRALRRRPRYWQSGVNFYPAAVLSIVSGPERRPRVRELTSAVRQPRVGASLDWRDPGPGIVAAITALVRLPQTVRAYFRYRRRDPSRHV